MRLMAAILWLAAGAALAQHGSTTRSNPFNSPEDQAEGARLFRVQCAACHGPNGSGGAGGPALTGALRRGDGDEAIYQAIVKGIAGTPMPPYGGSGRDAWQMTAYVQSLRVGNAAAQANGDASRGARIFSSHGCRQCHAVGGEGGALGPDLASTARSRPLPALRRALTHPDDEVSPEYWMVKARTKTGEEISGIRLNEDSHSIQYRDSRGLRSLLKDEMARVEIVRSSAMPSFSAKLSAAEIEDLIAYLVSLRGRP
jgi:putative heme-binding domain-containing protein